MLGALIFVLFIIIIITLKETIYYNDYSNDLVIYQKVSLTSAFSFQNANYHLHKHMYAPEP